MGDSKSVTDWICCFDSSCWAWMFDSEPLCLDLVLLSRLWGRGMDSVVIRTAAGCSDGTTFGE